MAVPEHVYTLEQALDIIINGQYGRDVRQAIYDGIYRSVDEGAVGSIDLTAREGISNLTTEVNAALAEMNLHGGRTKLLDEQTAATATAQFTLPVPFTDFDSVWIHIEDVPIGDGTSASQTDLKIGNYTLPERMPKSTTAKSTVDITVQSITATSAVVKVVSVPQEWAAGGAGVKTHVYVIDEYSLPPKDNSNVTLNMSTRLFTLTNCTNAKVTAVGYGKKSADSGAQSGTLVRDSNGIVHLS